MFLLDNFVKLNKRSRYSLSIALMIIALLGVYNWVISPHTQYLSAAQKYEQALNQRNKTNKTILNNLKIKDKNLERLENRLDTLKDIAFTEDESKKFWTNIKKDTEDAGCYFNSISFFEEKQQPENSIFTTESAALNITGNYSSITQLIEKIASNPDKIWIDSLQLSAARQSSILQCDMTITIFKIKKE